MLTLAKEDKIEVMSEFSDWLQNQLDQREWTALDLARRAGLGRSTVTRILTGVRGAGPDVCSKIALALEEEPEKIFRLAGVLPEVEKSLEVDEGVTLRSDEELLLDWYRQLPDSQKETALDIIKGLVARSVKRQRFS